jgi:hypothetical protein
MPFLHISMYFLERIESWVVDVLIRHPTARLHGDFSL